MKYLNLIFEDKEFESVKELYDKLQLSWKDFIIKLVEEYNREFNR